MKIIEFLNKPFTLLDQILHRWILVVFAMVVSIFFINAFVPFNINRWNNDSGLEQFLRLSGFGIIAGFILIISQFPIRRMVGVKHFCVGTFALWFLGELLLMTIFFIFYQSWGEIHLVQFIRDIPNSLRYTMLGMLIPYSLALLFISQIIQKNELGKLTLKANKTLLNNELLRFLDEKGSIRFSVSAQQLLYLESADNYVIVYYWQNNKVEKTLLRNSMKNIESLLEHSSVKRCHRSYMINLEKIEFVNYEKAKCRVKLNRLDYFIPVSRKFYPEFKPYLNK